MKNENYEAFVGKFKPKKTTDDCYTPPEVYEIVKRWAVKENNWHGRLIVRPFYPGGNYENFNYPPDCVVIDNPPFSILSKIVDFFNKKGIDYFLFAPALTLLDLHRAPCHIGTGAQITYHNGAKVSTSFISSKGFLIRTAPSLKKEIETVCENKKGIAKYDYPDNVITGAKLGVLSKYGINFCCDKAVFIRRLDSQKEKKKHIYGAGYLISNEAVDVLQKAERKSEEREIHIWTLSEREKELIRNLDEVKEQR